jgi:5-methylcytosine-specific restriction endonuclease McrA
MTPLAPFLRAAIPEIAAAAHDLDAAVTAHSAGEFAEAAELIRRTNLDVIRDWTESLWGSKSPYVRLRAIPDAPPSLAKDQRIKVRMPTTAEKRSLFERDGFHCRFCGIPVIRSEVRQRIRAAYPDALPWGTTNPTQHAAFQAMWLQYDHLLPHARGGGNDLNNIVITCAPCNFARMNSTLEEVGLLDPRTRDPVRSSWDGLERFR